MLFCMLPILSRGGPVDPLLILLAALLIDALIGDPPILWRRFPHPVMLIGRLFAFLDNKLNRDNRSGRDRRLRGALVTLAAATMAVGLGGGVTLLRLRWQWGWLVEGVLTHGRAGRPHSAAGEYAMTEAILITGASSGLGAALALRYAAPGVLLFLGGRNESRLDAVARDCRTKGAEVEIALIDVTERAAMESWIRAADQRCPLTLLIANAGISGGTGKGVGESAEQTRAIFAANLDGVFNSVLPVIPLMQSRRRGQIALMSSLAGFRGGSSAPAYCGSKAAVRVWGEGLRGWLARDGIGVSVICPGFVETAMTAPNRFPMPFLLKADRAAEIMKSGIDANRGRITFPWQLAAIVWLLAALPQRWTDPLFARAPGKV
jgi:short-subunit dehydrogenase